MIVALAGTLAANAQITVYGGYNIEDINVNLEEGSMLLKNNGFKAGFEYNYALNDYLGVSAGLDFLSVSGKVTMGNDGANMKATAFGIPVHANLKLGITDAVKAIAYAGPELRYISDFTFGPTSVYDKDAFGDSAAHIEGRLGFGAGVEIMNLVKVFAGYGFGLTNLFKDKVDGDEYKGHTQSVFIGLGIVLPLHK